MVRVPIDCLLAGMLAMTAAPGVAAVPGLAAAQEPVVPSGAPAAAEAADSEVMAGENARDRMSVSVFINDQGPFPFIVDTGATRSVVSIGLARRLGLPAGPAVRMHDIGGVGEAATAKLARLRVGPLEIADVTAPALPAAYLGGVGIVGLDGLADGRVLIDFGARRMTVTRAARRREAAEPGTIVVTARRRFGQLILADADIGGERIFVIIDTGAQYSIANPVLRAKLGRRGTLPPPTGVALIGVTGNIVHADLALLPRMRIGGLTLGNVPVAFADAHPFGRFGLARKPAMLMGMDLLKTFDRVSLDFARKTVKFLYRPDRRRAIAAR